MTVYGIRVTVDYARRITLMGTNGYFPPKWVRGLPVGV